MNGVTSTLLAAKYFLHAGVRLGVHRLLADETLHVEAQLIVFDQRKRLLEQVDEKLLAGRQQQMQHVEHVRGERLVGHVVKRQLRPVEGDVARLEDQSLVIAPVVAPGSPTL